MEPAPWQTPKLLNFETVQHRRRTLSHLLICLEDVLCGNRAHSCAQRFDHSICHLCPHAGGVGVQNTEVALVTLHHQLQGAPLGVHAVDVYGTLLTPPASTCRHTHSQINLVWQIRKTMKCYWARTLSINPAVSLVVKRIFLPDLITEPHLLQITASFGPW